MNNPILAGQNALVNLDSGVWVKENQADRSFIDYTDGTQTEEQVYAQVEAATDRSVFSVELDKAWDDWALEYHLGSKRSNIYRGLNLTGVKTVLEVGCGCGAITRFLGEQGFQVDSIEGTMRRAEIARLRTADIENVQIISSNYHDLVLSENSYDLVVFTGVLEYSGAYAAKGVSPEEQLEITLRHAQAALTPEGQILIAIENRTGFKYLAGASEDHLNVRNVGLLGYVEPLSGDLTRGIRTWSKSQWQAMLRDFDFKAVEFCYPFPDYKVPDAILSEQFLANKAYPEQVLGGIESRDYFTPWKPNLPESLFWRMAAQTHSLDQFANSFLIVVGNSDLRLHEIIDFDFVRFASVHRKPEYRMQVVKKCGESFVRRLPLMPSVDSAGALLTQVQLEQEVFVDGEVLETVWTQALSVTPTYAELSLRLKQYASWIDALIEPGVEGFVDALPRNVIVDSMGDWHLIDQEWRVAEGFTREILLFRMLFHFALNARDTLANIELESGRRAIAPDSAELDFPLIQTLDDFLEWGFAQLGLDFPVHRAHCLTFEEGMQSQVSLQQGVASLSSLMSAPIGRWRAAQGFDFSQTPMEVRVFWTQLDSVWHLDHSVTAQLSVEHGLHAHVQLPGALCTHRFVRIDPAAYALLGFDGWLELLQLSLVVTRTNGEQEQVYSISSATALFQSARVKGMRLVPGDRILLTSAHAGMVLDLADIDWGEDIMAIHLDLDMEMSVDSNQVSARQILREETARVDARVRLRQHVIDRQSQRIESAAKRLAALEHKIEQGSTTVLGRLLGRFGLMRKYKV